MKIPIKGNWDQGLVKTPAPAYPLPKVNPEVEMARMALVGAGADYWLELSKWAKERNFLEGWERSLAYSLGRLIGKGAKPSDKQSVQGLRILSRAKELGFSP
jgi:hypothetical protein